MNGIGTCLLTICFNWIYTHWKLSIYYSVHESRVFFSVCYWNYDFCVMTFFMQRFMQHIWCTTSSLLLPNISFALLPLQLVSSRFTCYSFNIIPNTITQKIIIIVLNFSSNRNANEQKWFLGRYFLDYSIEFFLPNSVRYNYCQLIFKYKIKRNRCFIIILSSVHLFMAFFFHFLFSNVSTSKFKSENQVRKNMHF